MDESFPLRLSSPSQEGEMRVSKWLKHGVLLTEQEMQSLLGSLPPLFLVPAAGVVSDKSPFISIDAFMDKYRAYLDWMETGVDLPTYDVRKFFSLMCTVSTDCLYAIQISSGRYIIKPLRPVIMIQLHHFFFSRHDQKLYSMTASSESIAWGVQISYPQVYEDPKTHTFDKIDIIEKFPNTAVFHTCVQWLRKNTVPTPLMIEMKKMYAPFRMGKNAALWSSKHAGLLHRQMRVAEKVICK